MEKKRSQIALQENHNDIIAKVIAHKEALGLPVEPVLILLSSPPLNSSCSSSPPFSSLLLPSPPFSSPQELRMYLAQSTQTFESERKAFEEELATQANRDERKRKRYSLTLTDSFLFSLSVPFFLSFFFHGIMIF